MRSASIMVLCNCKPDGVAISVSIVFPLCFAPLHDIIARKYQDFENPANAGYAFEARLYVVHWAALQGTVVDKTVYDVPFEMTAPGRRRRGAPQHGPPPHSPPSPPPGPPPGPAPGLHVGTCTS